MPDCRHHEYTTGPYSFSSRAQASVSRAFTFSSKVNEVDSDPILLPVVALGSIVPWKEIELRTQNAQPFLVSSMPLVPC